MKLARALQHPERDVYASAFLRGGTSATAVFGTWGSVTDGEFAISIDGVAYDVTGIDFTGVADMDDVAAQIQSSLRAATGGSEVVVWETDHFVIISGVTTSSSAVSKASTVSGGSGTDISGAGGTAYMDADAGASDEEVGAAALGYQTLTTSFSTLGRQFSIAHAGQMSLKMVHKARASGKTMTYYIEVSDDKIDVAEGSSTWHPIGAQDNAGGSPAVLTDEDYQITTPSSADTSDDERVPLRYTDTAMKARILVKGSEYGGRCKSTLALVEH